ncbi:MAG: DUF302 domain-containing protein [Saprospiraceae bacterium]|nr:DUF302 domain-containing protein [Saprospiraceae bacterium]
MIIGILIGVVLTIAAFVIFFYTSASKLMFHENESLYGFEETETKLKEEVAANDWKLLHVHDLQEKMIQNGFDVIESKVFDLCKPAYSGEILLKDDERIISSIMPCGLALYKKSNGKTYVSRMNSGLMAKPMKGIIPGIMKKATDDVEKILEPIIKK